MYTLTDPAKKNYFEGALEPALKYFAQKEEDKLKSDSLEGSIAAANESEMFDSDFAAYEQMAKQLRDTLPEAMKSDVEMKAWEARLAQANAYLESSKAYYTKNYAIYDQNMNASQGANSAELESRGLRDAHSASDYDEEMLMLNNRNMFTITVDENGQFVMNDGTGINDHFDEEHFRQDLVPTDIRQPETYWPNKGTVDMPASQEDLETKIYAGIVDDPLEKINAERWYKNDRGMDPTVELNEDQREDAYRKYAEEAAADAYRAEQERQDDAEQARNDAENAGHNFVLESVQDDLDTRNIDVIYEVDQYGYVTNNGRHTEGQESFVNINDTSMQAELELNLSNAPQSEIMEQGRPTAKDMRPGSPTYQGDIRTYTHGFQDGYDPGSQFQRPIRFSVSPEDDPGTMRVYFKMPPGSNYDPPVQHILVREGSQTWKIIGEQLGEDWLNDVYAGLKKELPAPPPPPTPPTPGGRGV